VSLVEITVQPTENPDIRAYNTRIELSSKPEAGMRGCSEGLGEFGQLVLDIRGVMHVFVNSYVMLVTKASLFDWCEIDPSIQDLLKGLVISQRLIDDAHAHPETAAESGIEVNTPSSGRVPRKGRHPRKEVFRKRD